MPLFDTTATPPGQLPARISKRASEARSYTVDCRPLLAPHELLVRVLQHLPPADPSALAVTSAHVCADCTTLQLGLAAGAPPAGQPTRDWPLLVTVKTTQGTLDIELAVRVHASPFA